MSIDESLHKMTNTPFPGWQSPGLPLHSRGLLLLTQKTLTLQILQHIPDKSAVVLYTDWQNVWPCTFIRSPEPSWLFIGLTFRHACIGWCRESLGHLKRVKSYYGTNLFCLIQQMHRNCLQDVIETQFLFTLHLKCLVSTCCFLLPIILVCLSMRMNSVKSF